MGPQQLSYFSSNNVLGYVVRKKAQQSYYEDRAFHDDSTFVKLDFGLHKGSLNGTEGANEPSSFPFDVTGYIVGIGIEIGNCLYFGTVRFLAG